MKFSAWLLLAYLGLAGLPLRGTGLVGAAQPPGEAAPQAVRVVGPPVLPRGTRQLLYVEGLYEGKNWKPLHPDHFRVTVTGAARPVADPSGLAMNPVDVQCADVAGGKVTVAVGASGRSAARSFAVGRGKPVAAFEAVVNPRAASHRFFGLGSGVLFYDNQFDITAGDDLYDWCFRDVRASFLHVLIRPTCEKENSNDDWRVLDPARFDFTALQRPCRVIKKALERNPDLKVYASLYSPPAWMKTNESTSGPGSLKEGLRYRQFLARYVFAYLKHLRGQGIPVHYLGLFNEPDFRHTQEGMYMPDLGALAEAFDGCTGALDALIAADPVLKAPPVYVFPDTLGAGSITRAGQNGLKLRGRVRLLDRVGVWGVHDYWDQAGTYRNNRFQELRAFPGVGQRPIWVTEWCQRDRHGDLASGVEYGAQMLNALRLGAEAWMAFEWCHPGGNQAGLISTDWGAKAPRARYWRSKAYHVFRQVANTTPAGAQVVAMTGRWPGISQARGKGVEYLALRDGENVIVHLQNTEPVPVPCRVSVRAAVGKAEGWLTTPEADMAPAGERQLTFRRQAGGALVTAVVPGHSLLSCVLRGQPAGKKTP